MIIYKYKFICQNIDLITAQYKFLSDLLLQFQKVFVEFEDEDDNFTDYSQNINLISSIDIFKFGFLLEFFLENYCFSKLRLLSNGKILI